MFSCFQNFDTDKICVRMRWLEAFLRALRDVNSSNLEAIRMHGIVCPGRRNISKILVGEKTFLSI